MSSAIKKGNIYILKAYLGYDNGKQIIKTKTWKPPKKTHPKTEQRLADEAAAMFERELRYGRILDTSTTFSEFSEKWMHDYALKKLSPSTCQRYTELLRRINAAIGHIKLDDLRPTHLNEFYDMLEQPGVNLKAKRDENGNIISNSKLSPKTIMEHHRAISSILAKAVKWQVISENVAERADPPAVPHKEISCYDEEEVKNMLNILENDEHTTLKMKIFITLLVGTGMRRGEACALMWSDINFTNKTLFVRRSINYISNKGKIEKGPKNLSSIRKITLTPALIDLLLDYKKWQDEEKAKIGEEWTENNLVFPNSYGGYLHPDVPTTAFKRFLRRTGLREVSLHSLRHSNASMLITNGSDVRTVAGRLGHSNPTTTLKTYSHVFKQADVAAAESLNNVLDIGSENLFTNVKVNRNKSKVNNNDCTNPAK